MSRTEGVVLAILLVLGALFFASAYTETCRQEGEPGQSPLGVDVSADLSIGDDLDCPWLAQASDIEEPLARPHPLYSRPAIGRPAHAELAQNGWQAWYVSPPSEVSGP